MMAEMMQKLAFMIAMTTAAIAPAVVMAAEPAPETPAPKQGTDAQTAGPAVATSPAARQPASGTAPAPQAQRAGNDRLDLGTTVVTGNRELPKVLYIVPWKKADIGDLPAQPFNTLLDEVLTPVDRDVFRREVTYYGAVSSAGNTAAPAPPASANGSEK